jgi:2-keto-4-pentenoate hydratase
MDTTAEDQAAEMIVKGIGSLAKAPGLPEGARPATLEQAYSIQDAVLRKLGTVGGWKVAPAKPGAEPRCSPVPAGMVFAAPAKLAYGQAEPEIEIEIAARMAKDLPPRPQPYTLAEVKDAIGSLHPAIEVLHSRFGTRGDVDPLTAIADLQSCLAIVYGPGTKDWAGFDFTTMDMGLRLDGKPTGQPKEGPRTEKVLEAIAWLANHSAGRNGGLKAGQVIITGARIKYPAIPAGTRIEAEIKPLGSVAAQF